MKQPSNLLLPFAIVLTISNPVNASSYSYEISDSQTWANAGATTSATQYVTVRAYVPGSNRINYSTVPIYSSTYSSNANSLGDIVGSVSNIYGTSPAWVDPYDGPKYSLMYPTYDVMRTRMITVNDDRLAIGSYVKLGGTTTSFIYDLIYKQFTKLTTPGGAPAAIVDINNIGQVAGLKSTFYGNESFVYDCINGFQDFIIPESASTAIARIDDLGNIYGRVYGLDENMTYFIARPDSLTDTSTCSLVARDDVVEPIEFHGNTHFEMSGDTAQRVKVGDFNHGGADDIFVYHEMGKYILYIGESGFKDKIKNFSDWDAVTQNTGVTPVTEWDFNNDGLIDKVDCNLLYLAKNVDEYYYVPQTLPVSIRAAYGDFDGDGRLDVASFSDAFVSVAFQGSQASPQPVIEPTPDPVIVEPTPTPPSNTEVPAIDVDAEVVEMISIVKERRDNNVMLLSGDTLWFSADSIIKFNDAPGFAIGQTLEFKAWLNPDGALVGIKVEVVE